MKTHTAKLVSLSLFLAALLSVGVAQSSQVTGYESQYTSTEVEYEFSGLPADTELAVQEELSDGSTNNVATFTTSPSGSAIVNWVHTPFKAEGADIRLDETGWNYRVVNPETGETLHYFGLKHGNMMLGLDTFDDLYINPELWFANATNLERDNTIGELVEESSDLSIRNPGDCGLEVCANNVVIGMQKPVTQDEVLYFNGTAAGNSRYDTWSDNPGNIALSTSPTENLTVKTDVLNTGTNTYSRDAPQYLHQVLYNQSTGAWEVWQEDSSGERTKLASEPSTVEEVYMTIHKSQDGENAEAEAQMNSMSIIPKNSMDAYSKPTRFDLGESLSFSDFKINQNNTAGVEFQGSESDSWSVSLPGLSDYLDYRVVNDGELQELAVNTDKGSSAVNFNLISPENNSITVIEDGSTYNMELQWEWLYQINEDDFLTIATVLENKDTGNTVDQTVYTDYRSPIVQPFSRTVELEPGTYEWYNELTNSDTGETYTETVTFEIVEESNSSATFNLLDPADGATVNLTGGRYDFQFGVDTERNGTVNLMVPQESSDPVFTQDLSAGSSTVGANIPLAYEQDYDWFLELDTSYYTDYEGLIDSFEDGNFNETPEWTVSSTGSVNPMEVIRDSSIAYEGNYVLYHEGSSSTDNSDYRIKTGVDPNEEIYSTWIRFSGTGTDRQGMYLYDETGAFQAGLIAQSGDVQYVAQYTGSNFDFGVQPSGQWVKFEIDTTSSSETVYTVYNTDGDVLEQHTEGFNPSNIYELELRGRDTGVDTYFDFVGQGADPDNRMFIEETYTSRVNSFTTTGIENDPDPDGNETDTGTGDDDSGTDGQILDFAESWFQALSAIGFEGLAAELLTGTLITLFTAAVAFNFGGVAGGVGGLLMGILISGIVGLYPSWMVFAILVLTGAVVGKWGRSVFSS